MTLKQNLVTAKFRFDLGMSFLTIVNLSLLTLTASERLQEFLLTKTPININTPSIIMLIISSALIGTLLFGFLLDKTFSYFQTFSTIQNERNPQISKILSDVEYIKNKIDGGDK